jgi:fumarate hydratase subunit alpha
MTTRQIHCVDIISTVSRLCIEANYQLGDDVVAALRRASEEEESPLGRQILEQLIRNAEIAREGEIPLCQDTGLTVVFVELGQDVHVFGGSLVEAIQEGVRTGYKEGYLRKSVVESPFSERVNTGDNTPAVLHIEIVAGHLLRIVVVPKGGGSENMSALGMLKPADGREGVINFVVETVERAGANPCPPTIVGVGIGGSAEKAMLMAKHSLLREVGHPSPDPEVAVLERDILARINESGIGPQGLGGRVTSMVVHVETFPCHIASLPVGVNIQCHSARHREAVL